WGRSGWAVGAARSEEMEATIGRSRGGKGWLAPSPRSVFENKLPLGPTLPPTPDAVGVKAEASRDLDIGKRRILVQKQDQARSLSKVRLGRARGRESPSLGEELGGKARVVAWPRS